VSEKESTRSSAMEGAGRGRGKKSLKLPPTKKGEERLGVPIGEARGKPENARRGQRSNRENNLSLERKDLGRKESSS